MNNYKTVEELTNKGYEYIVDKNGDKSWYLNGNRHREDGPAIEWADGDKSWYINGNRHREDGPAYIGANGDKEWCLNGNKHREDGPAVENKNGSKYWYINGNYYGNKEPDNWICLVIEYKLMGD